ncbi:Clr5 domain-containing protein [Apiospora aurea]|uniref:Clr5 domain-containing protein n=1 Tax=Apiospora aurea TaxID=335848 RepID=A0ABR1QFR4_9PEZI
MSMDVADSLALRGKLPWAADADWTRHRETITRLWWDENKPLKEVSRMMKEEYGFHATDRMFKMRFSAWGLQKNLKKQDLQKIASEAYLTKKPKLPVIRGRQLGSRRLRQRLQRASATSKQQQLQAASSDQVLQSIRLAAPGSAGAAEKSIQAVLEYTESRFATRAWRVEGEYDFDQDTGNAWWLNIKTAQGDIQSGGRATARGFKLLNGLFAEYAELLRQQHPQTVLATVAGYASLSCIDPALGESLLNYVTSLSNIKLGPAHPYARIWTNLRNTRAAQHTVSTLVTAHFDVISVHAPGGNRFRLASLIQILAALQSAKMISFESSYAALSAIANAAEPSSKKPMPIQKPPNPPTTPTTDGANEGTAPPPKWPAEPEAFWRNLAQRYLCKFLLNAGRLREAERSMHAMEASHMASGSDNDHVAFLQMKTFVSEALGRTADAEAACRRWYDVTRRGRTLHTEFLLDQAAVWLEESYRKRGDHAAADAFRRDITSMSQPFL